MKKSVLFVLVVLCTLGLRAQVSTVPAIIEAGYTGQIVITYDATKGNGALASATAIYAHTGLITAASKNNGDWKNVKGTWGSKSQPALTKNDDGKWELIIDNMYTFYGVPETTDIKALAFVFHDGKGNNSTAGKTASNGDIFIWIGEDNTEADIWEAVEGVTGETKARPEGISQGIYYDENDPTKVTLCTYAASKTEPAKRVFVLGDMTDWKLSSDYVMKRDGNYFWITLTGLTPGKEYRFQYAVERSDGVKKQLCDLYSEKVLHPDDQWEPKTVDPTLIEYPKSVADGGYVTVIQTNKPKYQWSDATLNFKRPSKKNLVIYEVWVYDYTTSRTFKALKKRLDYIQNLGVNAIELMPVSEFEGNYSWGYNPTLYFALDKAYGTPNDLKSLIDECHKRGIAVIVDMVFNHTTGLNPMAKLYPYGTELNNYNPWFVAPSKVKHSDNDYGEDWNHDFEPAHEMFTRVFQYWLKEYKVDGFRLDLSHGLCGETKYNSPENLKDYYQKGVQATSPGAYMILEHWGDRATQDRPGLIEAGMLCWINTNNAYCQTAMGWLKDGDSFADANKAGYVSYAESHDEERMQYKAKTWGAYNIKEDSVRLGRVAENVAFNVLLNGAHMLWQFEEIGYDFSIDQNGRTGTKPNPSTKGYFTQAERVDAFTKCAQVITLRTQLMASTFINTTPTAVNVGSGKALRTIQWGVNVFAAANFDTIANLDVTLPSGTWYDYLEGGTTANATYTLVPGELKVFTGTAVQAPKFEDIETRDHTPIESVTGDGLRVTGVKFIENGRLYIRANGKVFDMTGRVVRVEN